MFRIFVLPYSFCPSTFIGKAPYGLVCTLHYPISRTTHYPQKRSTSAYSVTSTSDIFLPSPTVIFQFFFQSYLIVQPPDNWEIERTEIIMNNKLGCGQYGDVYQGFTCLELRLALLCISLQTFITENIISSFTYMVLYNLTVMSVLTTPFFVEKLDNYRNVSYFLYISNEFHSISKNKYTIKKSINDVVVTEQIYQSKSGVTTH